MSDLCLRSPPRPCPMCYTQSVCHSVPDWSYCSTHSTPSWLLCSATDFLAHAMWPGSPVHFVLLQLCHHPMIFRNWSSFWDFSLSSVFHLICLFSSYLIHSCPHLPSSQSPLRYLHLASESILTSFDLAQSHFRVSSPWIAMSRSSIRSHCLSCPGHHLHSFGPFCSVSLDSCSLFSFCLYLCFGERSHSDCLILPFLLYIYQFGFGWRRCGYVVGPIRGASLSSFLSQTSSHFLLGCFTGTWSADGLPSLSQQNSSGQELYELDRMDVKSPSSDFLLSWVVCNSNCLWQYGSSCPCSPFSITFRSYLFLICTTSSSPTNSSNPTSDIAHPCFYSFPPTFDHSLSYTHLAQLWYPQWGGFPSYHFHLTQGPNHHSVPFSTVHQPTISSTI